MARGRVENLTNAGKGRPKGSVNKATADIKALAQLHAVAAMKELARIAVEAESDAARVAAIKELFDRGYGKAKQTVGGDDENPISIVTRVILEAAHANSPHQTTP